MNLLNPKQADALMEQEINKLRDQLYAVKQERDELKTWLEDQVCEAKDFAYKLENKTIQLTRYRAVMEQAVESLTDLPPDPSDYINEALTALSEALKEG